MSGRTRNMAADAAHLAGLGTGPSGSASGHRAHRRLRAQQGGAASDALDGRVPGLAAAQVLVEARHDLDEIAGTVAVAELVHQDLVPGIAAGARRARQAEDVGAAGNSGGRANGAILAQDSALLLLAGLPAHFKSSHPSQPVQSPPPNMWMSLKMARQRA